MPWNHEDYSLETMACPPRVKPTKHNTDTLTTVKAEGFPLFICAVDPLSLKWHLSVRERPATDKISTGSCGLVPCVWFVTGVRQGLLCQQGSSQVAGKVETGEAGRRGASCGGDAAGLRKLASLGLVDSIFRLVAWGD